MVNRRILVPLLSLLLAVAACTQGTDLPGLRARPTPKASRRPPVTVGAIEWKDCGEGFDCAQLAVPLDYANPRGRKIELSLSRKPAEKPAERIGSLLTNPGGPGASGIGFLRSGLLFDQRVLDRFDVVSWDPRGVNESNPLRCEKTALEYYEPDYTPDDPAEAQALHDAARRLVDACKTTDGEVLPHVGTIDTARDMDSIRQALGEDKLTYVGLSYGTRLGLVYAENFGKKLRAMVLDGVEDPSVDAETSLIQQAVAVDAAFEAFLADCRNDESCPIGPDPDKAYRELVAGVERKPLDVDGDQLGPTELAIATIAATYDSDAWEVLAQSIADGLDGDGAGLHVLAESYVDSVSFAANLAINCLDQPAPRNPAEFEAFQARAAAAAPRFGAYDAALGLPCYLWPVPANLAPRKIAAPDAPTILVIGTTGDNATPYKDAVAVAEMLAHAVLLTYKADRHTSYGGSECATGAVADYLVDLKPPPPDTTCPS